MRKKICLILVCVVSVLACIFGLAACGASADQPYYGTYQPIGSGSEIAINKDGCTWGETAQYTYDEYNKEIYVEKYDIKFKLFNDYTILALTAGQVGGWTSFDFEDYGDGTIYLRCLRLDIDYKLKELLSVKDDGTFSYFSSPYTTINGTYRYKDRFIKFSSDSSNLSGAYVANDKTLYAAVWIKDYDNFWNNNEEPSEPTEPVEPVEPIEPTEPDTPIEPTKPTDPTEIADYGYFTAFVYNYGQSILDTYNKAYGEDYIFSFTICSEEEILSAFKQPECEWRLLGVTSSLNIETVEIVNALIIDCKPTDTNTDGTPFSTFFAFNIKSNDKYSYLQLSCNGTNGELIESNELKRYDDTLIYYLDNELK